MSDKQKSTARNATRSYSLRGTRILRTRTGASRPSELCGEHMVTISGLNAVRPPRQNPHFFTLAPVHAELPCSWQRTILQLKHLAWPRKATPKEQVVGVFPGVPPPRILFRIPTTDRTLLLESRAISRSVASGCSSIYATVSSIVQDFRLPIAAIIITPQQNVF